MGATPQGPGLHPPANETCKTICALAKHNSCRYSGCCHAGGLGLLLLCSTFWILSGIDTCKALICPGLVAGWGSGTGRDWKGLALLGALLQPADACLGPELVGLNLRLTKVGPMRKEVRQQRCWLQVCLRLLQLVWAAHERANWQVDACLQGH